MRAIHLAAKISLALATCLLTASCADFFKNEKVGNTAAPSPTTPQSPGSTVLPAEFQKPNEGPFSEQKMLINIGTNIIARDVEAFATQVPVLKNSLRQYCEALSTGAPARREETQVQLDWERVMLAYHAVQAAPFGPLLDNGREINDFLYSWPMLNTCDIDRRVVDNAKATVDVNSLKLNVRGLGAVEYLLFEKSLKSTCNLRAHPAMAEWNARDEQSKKLERCAWAQELVKDIEVKATSLQNKWSVQNGNFTKALIDGSRYKSMKDAINALTDALANIEKVKDLKLGRPLARHKDCTSDKCPRDAEHFYSGLSLASVEAQLKAFRAIFVGSYSAQPGFGLDDLLEQAGRTDVSNKIVAALDKALASVRAVQNKGTLVEQIDAMDSALCKASTMSDRKEEICAVHADVRDVAFLLKTEVLAALALRAPPTHQGDND